MRHKIKSKLLYKYITSYFLVFFIPFIIMSMFVYSSSVSSLSKEIEQSNINKLKQTVSITDERMRELSSLATRISFDKRLTPYMINHSYYAKEAMEELAKYEANSSIIADLFVYYRNSETLYSSNGSYSIDALLSNKYMFSDWNKEKMLSDLHTNLPLVKPIKNTVINNENHENMLAYLFPIPTNNSSPYGTVLFLVKESSIHNLLQTISGGWKGNVYIYNDKEEMVTSIVNDTSIKEKQTDDLLSYEDGVQEIKLNGSEYSLISLVSEVSGWKFITVLDTDQFWKRLDNTNIVILILLVTLLFFGIAMAILFGKNQYRPIKNLVDITNEDEKKKMGLVGDNELETIQNRITYLFENHQTLSKTIYLQQPFAREQFLIKLLKGDYNDPEIVDSLLHSFDIQMERGTCFVIVFYLDKKNVFQNMDEEKGYITVLSNILMEKGTAYTVDLLYNNTTAMIVNLNDCLQNAMEWRKKLVFNIQEYIKSLSNSTPTMGIGQLYEDKIKINHSYIEALAALEYKFMNPMGSVLFFEAIGSYNERAMAYPEEDKLKLTQSIKQGDRAVALEALSDIFQVLSSHQISIQESKLISYDIINTIVKTASELGLDYLIGDLSEIAEFTSVEQLFDILHVLTVKLCETVDEKKMSHNKKLGQELLQYVRQNFKMYDLSLENLACEFQLSISYLSRFFKDQTGVTFTQFIQELRMEEMKKQLKQTDKPIKEIVVNVGYKDVPNFTRKFKKIVGVTPGQYRKLTK